MITYSEIIKDENIKTYIRKADESLQALGFTEHSFAHVMKVAENAAYTLSTMEYDEHNVEVAKIAGYLHDIGNLINRVDHSQSGAIMAFRILDHMDMTAEDISTIVTAIGNHDEGTGVPVNAVSAALIIADKTDVRRSRVRNKDFSKFDIHDRVNYSVVESSIKISDDKKNITLDLTVDTEISPVMDYFEIFTGRMLMCRRAAEKLGLNFKLTINGQGVL